MYAATAAATRSFARTWASELKGRGIRVNTIRLGQTDTPRSVGARSRPGAGHRPGGAPGCTGDAGRQEDCAAAVTFLASGQSGFITGSNLYVDGVNRSWSLRHIR